MYNFCKNIYKKYLKKRILVKNYLNGSRYVFNYMMAIEVLNKVSVDPNTSAYINRSTVYKTNMIDLSIIIPVYNAEQYLEKCLQSVFSQKTKYTYEVIIVNDGSKDTSKDIIERFNNRKGFNLVEQSNKGFSGARNSGLKNVLGKYVMFVDSDDMLEPNSIECLLNTAETYGCDVVSGDYSLVLPDGSVIPSIKKYSNGKVDPNGNLHGQPWGKIYDTGLFEHLCFPENYWYEDSIFAQIIWPLSKNCYTISDCVYKYNVNPKGITAQSKNCVKAIDSLYITKKLMEERIKFGLAFDKKSLEYFLNMVKLTYQRTMLLEPKIVKAIFIVQCELFKRYKDVITDKDINLQKALLDCNYWKYLIEVQR